MAGEPWWRTYFDDVFFRLHDPLFAEADSRREVAAMLEWVGLPAGARILDAPCGWGRHTRLLDEAGLVAFGADLSPALLRKANEPASATSAPPRGLPTMPPPTALPTSVTCGALGSRRRARYAAADVRALPFADASFDAVINVFTSIGLFASDREDIRVLREAARVLGPRGRLLLETMHRDEVVSDYAERDAWTLPDGTRVEMRRRFDPVTGISHERLRWTRGDERGEKRHALRLRTATEVAGLLRTAGFRDVEYYGGWDGEPFDHRSEHLIVVAIRA